MSSKTGGAAPGFCERRIYADGTLSLDTGEAPVCKKSSSAVTRRFRELAASRDLRSSVHEVAASRNYGWYEDAAELVIRLDDTRAVLPAGQVIVPVPIEALFAEIDAAFAREFGKAYRVRLLPEGYGVERVKDPSHRVWISETVKVIAVSDEGSKSPVRAARVFVLDAVGKTVWSGLTDGQGIAQLPYDDIVNRQPALILVEKELMYITGVRWRETAREYRVVLGSIAMY